MQMSAIQAPIRPKIPPLAPTLIYSGRKIADKIVPPTAGMMNSIAAAANPWHCSTALPINHNALKFKKYHQVKRVSIPQGEKRGSPKKRATYVIFKK